MALTSMTGFARVEGALAPYAWAWEVKSVNGRGLDVRVRAPSGFEGLEAVARAAAQARFRRGSVHASLQMRRAADAGAASVDVARIEALLAATEPLLRRGAVAPPRLDGLLALRGVLESAEETDAPDARAKLAAALGDSLQAAFDALSQARGEEGGALAGVLGEILDRIAELRVQAAALDAAQAPAIHARIRTRLQELLGERLAEERVATEAAAMALKADVREELDRLAAHIETARAHMAQDEAVGRKLEFLSQELMREANTLCAKSADLELTRIGLELKAAIDQFREQVQNVE